jgi:predicted O-methyltransferase YrrM
MSHSVEQTFVTEELPANQRPADPYFGEFFEHMRRGLVAGGSEFGLGMTLFSLAVSIRAKLIVEIGRFKGFSTVCLASAVRFLEQGWQEPQQHKQRDIDYARHEGRRPVFYSIDPFPTDEAEKALVDAGVMSRVHLLNGRSDQVALADELQIDLLFIDGDHSYEGVKYDVERFVPHVRPGGYFVLHDYFGWFDGDGNNKSPIKRACDEIKGYDKLLIDTGYQSFMVFKK